jgi:HlyD family secretion protein
MEFAKVSRRRAALALAAVAVAAIALAASVRFALGPEVPFATVVKRDFVQTVVATGRVETPHRTNVGVQVTGKVLKVLADEGDAVAEGAPLIELESSELRSTLRQSELAVAQAQARLRQVREVQAPGAEQALRQAQANYDVAQRTLARNRDLFDKQFIGQAALDDAARAEQVALAQLRTARQQLASAKPGGSDEAAAQATLAESAAAADAARARLAYTSVRAPVGGTVIARNVEPGDLAQPGKSLMVLSPTGETQLVVLIDEKNLNVLRLGQPAAASADAYPEARFESQVVFINPAVDPQRGSVEVKLRVPQPPKTLKQDMTVSVEIEVARRAQAVLVPLDALHDADSPQPWVLVLDDGHARKSPVKLGLRSAHWAEVLHGVAPGDQVVLATADASDGSRVRATSAAAH